MAQHALGLAHLARLRQQRCVVEHQVHVARRLFDELVADMRFTLRLDGETREMGEEEVLSYLYDPDRDARRARYGRGLRDLLRDVDGPDLAHDAFGAGRGGLHQLRLTLSVVSRIV